MKEFVQKALDSKVVWPWVRPSEDMSQERGDILKSRGEYIVIVGHDK